MEITQTNSQNQSILDILHKKSRKDIEMNQKLAKIAWEQIIEQEKLETIERALDVFF